MIPDVGSEITDEQINLLGAEAGLDYNGTINYLLTNNLIENVTPEPEPDPSQTTYYWTQVGLQGLLDIGYTQEELPELNSVVIEQQVIDFSNNNPPLNLEESYQDLITNNFITDQNPNSEPAEQSYYWTPLGIQALEDAGTPQELLPEEGSLLTSELLTEMAQLIEFSEEETLNYLIQNNFVTETDPNEVVTYYWTSLGIQALIDQEYPTIPDEDSELTDELLTELAEFYDETKEDYLNNYLLGNNYVTTTSPGGSSGQTGQTIKFK